MFWWYLSESPKPTRRCAKPGHTDENTCIDICNAILYTYVLAYKLYKTIRRSEGVTPSENCSAAILWATTHDTIHKYDVIHPVMACSWRTQFCKTIKYQAKIEGKTNITEKTTGGNVPRKTRVAPNSFGTVDN